MTPEQAEKLKELANQTMAALEDLTTLANAMRNTVFHALRPPTKTAFIQQTVNYEIEVPADFNETQAETAFLNLDKPATEQAYRCVYERKVSFE